ncbi:hypothetical protein CSO01_33750 [Cellulomonas soli]|uniref:Uncharacterized protein n=1 Tax=Cellulomonas soli TaxID=931535 RepID=A0A512PHJ0_9CELL|nr:hypothetical protein CSO01_33750 [Cellulomonas soli]
MYCQQYIAERFDFMQLCALVLVLTLSSAEKRSDGSGVLAIRSSSMPVERSADGTTSLSLNSLLTTTALTGIATNTSM